MDLSMAELVRMVAVTADCPHCGAHRGQLCTTREGRMLYRDIHTGRGLRARGEWIRRPGYREKLRQQLLEQKAKRGQKGEG